MKRVPHLSTASLALVVGMWSCGALAQDKTSLTSERDKTSYMVGMDIAHSIAGVAPDMDEKAFERALGNAVAGGKPLIAEEQAKPLQQLLMQRMAIRAGKAPAGTQPPAVDRQQVGYLVGSDVGHSLVVVKDDVDLPVLQQGVRAVLGKGTTLLTDAEAASLRTAFAQRIQGAMQARVAQEGSRNTADGAAFLARNKAVKGVFTTPSGLQYMVLRQGSGMRPKPSDQLRVNYQGALLDGTVFDSSYARNEPVELGVSQVIPGWIEGLQLMPVGAKYRFWIPGDLAYGAKGTPGGPIGPNATLVFDVELLSIL